MYKEIGLQELKSIQMNILDYVVDFCDNNDIHYWLDTGTLLGAIRHKGYIPWDDDIDIGMLRPDYDKFIIQFNSNASEQYHCHCIENDPNFYVPHAKVYDTRTVLYEPDENGYKSSVNIDVFVYDNAPDNDEIVTKMYDKRDMLRRRFNIQNERYITNKNYIVRIAKYLRRFLYTMLYKNCIQKMVENSKSYSNIETKRVGNFTSFTRICCEKIAFHGFIEVEFEGKKYKAPEGYDMWLKSFYGDYMRLPPVEKRVSHHSFKAYYID